MQPKKLGSEMPRKESQVGRLGRSSMELGARDAGASPKKQESI